MMILSFHFLITYKTSTYQCMQANITYKPNQLVEYLPIHTYVLDKYITKVHALCSRNVGMPSIHSFIFIGMFCEKPVY